MESAKRSTEEKLADLIEGRLALASFTHREHLRLAFEMLRRHSFGETVHRFAEGLKLLTVKAGKPEAYHETRTVAFLALIAERRARAPKLLWDDFIAANEDLSEKSCLELWYDAAELESETARRVFVLPRRALRSLARVKVLVG